MGEATRTARFAREDSRVSWKLALGVQGTPHELRSQLTPGFEADRIPRKPSPAVHTSGPSS